MMRSLITLFLAALAALPLFAADQQVPDKRPTEIWNRTGPLGDTPEHVTDEFPLSDQDNKGRFPVGWTRLAAHER